MMKQLLVACSVSLSLTAAASAQVPAGGEFRVNSYTTGRQSDARPGMEADGDFIVVWESNAQYSASGSPPRGRRGGASSESTRTPRAPSGSPPSRWGAGAISSWYGRARTVRA